jgi:hypothetical protein
VATVPAAADMRAGAGRGRSGGESEGVRGTAPAAADNNRRAADRCGCDINANAAAAGKKRRLQRNSLWAFVNNCGRHHWRACKPRAMGARMAVRNRLRALNTIGVRDARRCR